MPTLDSLQAFVLAAELGSFSAAARRMKKVQSAVSTAIANLEIDTGLQLFDRSTRSPTLTKAGETLLPHAKGILQGRQELLAKATSLSEGIEDRLCLAIEQGIDIKPLLEILTRFGEAYPSVSLEILTSNPSETANLLRTGHAQLGLMTERENFPTGFQFRGVGHTAMVSVCGTNHPFAKLEQVAHRDLRQHRQFILGNRSERFSGRDTENKSADIWYAEHPEVIIELLQRGIGWAELPLPTIQPYLRAGKLSQIAYSFQQSDELEGIDLVWTERHALGPAGQWILDQLLQVPQDGWSVR
ncbi:MAG: LysR family transcriptional regulator [Pseudomonadota bacterium]